MFCLAGTQTLKSTAAVRGAGAAAAGSLHASVAGPKSAMLASSSSSGSFKASMAAGTGRKGSAAAAADAVQQQQLQQMQGQLQQQQDTVQSLSREMDMQRELIAKLRAELDAGEEKIQSLEAGAVVRPMSRERLPPVEAVGAAAAQADAAGQLPAATLGGSSSMRARPGSARPGSSSGSRRASAAEAQRVLSRPGSSNAGGSSSRSGGVGRAASGLSAGDVDSREQELRSAGGMEPTPWETAGEGVGDADAGEEWAGQQQPDIVEQQQTANDSLAQQQTVVVD